MKTAIETLQKELRFINGFLKKLKGEDIEEGISKNVIQSHIDKLIVEFETAKDDHQKAISRLQPQEPAQRTAESFLKAYPVLRKALDTQGFEVKEMFWKAMEEYRRSGLPTISDKEICIKAHEITKGLFGTENATCFGNMEVYLQGVLSEIRTNLATQNKL